ncbi:hypothetical protein Y032_0046g1312 [Ancylostoma ceylanicum]|uniref:Anoctamin dimerisation domain-containing protein n=1 Tax=Ancylostoma ceylanicum TaxID=53326 RepID=A0A016UCN2_9BILA|nr:hypothetical protein Y032_0046g1312 [Ancylostoma ceylanicum]
MLRATTQVDYPYFPFRIPVDYVLVSRTDNLSRQYHRTLFERAAKKECLIIQHEYAGPICFTLISTPFHRLCREAEKMQLSFPLKDVSSFYLINVMKNEVLTLLSSVLKVFENLVK